MTIVYSFLLFASLALPSLGAWVGIQLSAQRLSKQLLEIEKIATDKISKWVAWRLEKDEIIENNYLLYAFLGALPGPLVLVFFYKSIGGAFGFLLLSLMLAGLTLVVRSGTILEVVKSKALIMAHGQIQDSESIQRVENWLKGLLTVKSGRIQMAALTALYKWGSDRSVMRLEKFDSMNRKSRANHKLLKTASRYAQEIKVNFAALEVERISTYPEFMNQNHYWLRLAQDAFSEGGLGQGLGVEIQGKKTLVILAKLKKQVSLKKEGGGRVFCVECKTRSEKKNHKSWHYLRCQSCKEMTFLRSGIAEVIGVLGPFAKEEIQAEKYFLPLWDDARNQAMPAEIDRLEIRSGLDLNYDWMVSATLEAIRNRFPNRKLSFEIEIDPQVKLSANTLNLVHGRAE